MADRKEKTRKTEEAINKHEGLKELDELCRGLDKPETFELAYKDHLVSRTESGTRFILTHQFSSQLEPGRVSSFYREYFRRIGWDMEDHAGITPLWIDFRKENLKVQVYYGGSPELIYGIGCSNIP